MKILTAILLLISTQALAIDVKLSDLPLGVASGTGVNDSFPYVDAVAGVTRRLKLSDLPNAPGFSAVSSKRTTNLVSADFPIPTPTKDYMLLVNTSGGAVSISLPSAATIAGICIWIKNLNTNAVNVIPNGTETIDLASSDAITSQYEARLYCAVAGNFYRF